MSVEEMESAKRVTMHDGERGSLQTRLWVKCGEEDPEPWTKVGVTPPKKGTAVGNYILEECLGGGAYGEAWTSRPSSGGAEVVIKIGREPITGQTVVTSRGAATGLDYECLFAQAIFARDPAHFTDCFEAGEWTSASKTKHSFAAFGRAPGTPLKKLARRDSPKFSSFGDELTLWLEFGEAMRAMSMASDADPFMLVDSDVIPDNVMVSSRSSPVVTIIDYGMTMMCCTAGSSESCVKSFRPGTGSTRTFQFPLCTDEQAAAELKRKVMGAMIEYGRVCAESAMSPLLMGKFAGLETFTEVIWPDYKAELAGAGATATELFAEVIKALFEYNEHPTFDEANPTSAGPPVDLLEKIRALRREVGK